MLLFIIPLQAPEASDNWTNVSRLARRTIQSVLGQINRDFHVILVCNQRPIGLLTHEKLQILEEPFPIPMRSEERMRDKWIKVRRALVEARNHLTPTHVMIVDADDLVSNRLAGLVASHPGFSPGWTISSGYSYEDRGRFLICQQSLHERCGSTSIISIENELLPATMNSPESHVILDYGHSGINAYFKSIGTPLTKVPFRGSIYVTGTGENHTALSLSFSASRRRFLRNLTRMRPLTVRTREIFGISRDD